MSGGRTREGEQATKRASAADSNAARDEGPASLTPGDKVVIAYLSIIAALILIFSYRIEWWVWLLAGHAAVIGLVILIAKCDHAFARHSHPLSRSPSFRVSSLIHGWYVIPMIALTYKELTYLIPCIHPRDLDATLAAIDFRVFGVHPTIWLERFTWPPLTEALQTTYSTYYFLPVVLGVVLWRAGRFDRFYFWAFIVFLGFYLSYFGYITVPATGPRFLPSIVEAQTKPLTGVLFFQTIRAGLDRFEGITRDCFPSGHTELTLLVLYYARKFHRKTFWWLLPFGGGIIVSTVYLRYHYVIDVVAGALLAAVIVMIAKPLHRALLGRTKRSSDVVV